MSYVFLLKNLKTISIYNKKKLAAEGYLTIIPIFNIEGILCNREFLLTEKAKIALGLKVEEPRSTYLRFCSKCGTGHWRKGKQFCTEECKAEKRLEIKKKELDFEIIMNEIRAKKKAAKEKSRQASKKYYAENREKMLDYLVDYRHRKSQEQIQLTILTTTI